MKQAIIKPKRSSSAVGISGIPKSLQGAVAGVEVLEVLGRGGMGMVFKGRQNLLNRLVAVKVLSINGPATVASSTTAARFAREARVLAKLNHPNIVSIYDYGVLNGFSYIMMDFVEGLTLRQILKSEGRLAPKPGLEIFYQICDGLQHAHEHGVTHRDIKPENILVDKRGLVKITDFGIAKIFQDGQHSESPTAEGHSLGTPYYMAPEQISQPETVDHRADIYSTGAVLYEMLTGELPLGRFPEPSRRWRSLRRLDAPLLQALEREPRARHPSAAAFKKNILRARSQVRISSRPTRCTTRT